MGSVYAQSIKYATGFEITYLKKGIKLVTVINPWPNANIDYTYTLVPRDSTRLIKQLKSLSATVIPIPVERAVMTSTTQLPALEILNKTETLVGFTGLDYISSSDFRNAINRSEIQELGANEKINIEETIALNPEVIFGFSVNGNNKAYEELNKFGVPIVFNGDWVENSPLAKAEWIKFTAAFYNEESAADYEFHKIESAYLRAKEKALSAENKPVVLSGALYQDIWYAPGATSWAAQFLADANASYVFRDRGNTGSLSLSVEEVIKIASQVPFWIAPAQFTSYKEMEQNNRHYSYFKAYRNKNIYTYALTKGATGGMLYFELASQRPDLVLQDLIYILHPDLLNDYKPTFFKPMLDE